MSINLNKMIEIRQKFALQFLIYEFKYSFNEVPQKSKKLSMTTQIVFSVEQPTLYEGF